VRAKLDQFWILGQVRWNTTYAYPGADRTDATPPDGAAPTSTFTDSRGRTTKLVQYHGSSPSGAGEATTYGYDSRGGMTSMSDAAGNDWSWTFDVLGRQVSAADPDTGQSTSGYDDAGRLVATSDARGQVLAYSYDDLDRRTGEYSGSLAGTRLASWTYDSLSKGQPTSSTRYLDGAAYTTAVTGYDDADRPLGSVVTIPSAAGALAGSYSTGYVYFPDGQLTAIIDPAQGGLPAETTDTGRTALGRPSSMGSLTIYVAPTPGTWTRYGSTSGARIG